MSDAQENAHDDALAIRGLIAELVRYALRDDGADAEAHARAARELQQTAKVRFGGSLPAGLDLDSLWNLAVIDAERDPTLRDHAGVSLSMPKQMPFTAAMLLDDPFDPEALRLRIRGAAATG